MIARMLPRETGGPQLFEMDGHTWALRDRSEWRAEPHGDHRTIERWRGVRVIELPPLGDGPRETRMRWLTVFVAPDGAVKGYTESNHFDESRFGPPMPELGEPERTWLERAQAAWEGT